MPTMSAFGVGGGSSAAKALVLATTGSPTTGSSTVDGIACTYYQWVGAGSITFSNAAKAYVKILCVGGGGACGGTDGSGYSCGGGGGGVHEGWATVQSGSTYTIAVAAAGGQSYVTASTVPAAIACAGAGTAGGGGRPCGTGYSGGGFAGGDGTNSGGGGGARGVGGGGSGGAGGAGVTSSITGTSVIYGQGGGGSFNNMTGVNTGGGGATGGAGGLPSVAGRAGVVVIAVPN